MLELDRPVEIDRSHFSFLTGFQVVQAALSVLAAIHSTATFLVFLNLSKAYESVILSLLLTKLQKLHRSR